ncbi:MAG: helix-turn-helix transcriptional regulator [Flavobacteriales bacterium]|nr:helix-turn-helix transcriptional regulator [Flavobacteriales bacterium]
MNKKEIAMRIKALREGRHLHQKEVAAVLGISPSAYCDRENGHTAFTAMELDKLAEYHGTTLDELLHADKAILHMHDHSSQGYNAYHMQHQHGIGEETMKHFLAALAANTKALEQLAEQQGRMVELLAKR